MKTIPLVTTAAAALFAVMVFATTAADARRGGGGIARGGGHSFGGRSIARAPRMAHRAPAMRRAPAHSAQRMRKPSVGRAQQKGLHKQGVAGKRPVAQQKRNVAGGAEHSQRACAKRIGCAGARRSGRSECRSGGGQGRGSQSASQQGSRGQRCGEGQSRSSSKRAAPAETLVNAPAAYLRPRFAPFVQRHWRRAFSPHAPPPSGCQAQSAS